MMLPGLFLWSAAWDACHPGPACLRKLCSPPCVLTKKHAPASCASFSRRMSARRAPTTTFLSQWSSEFFTSPRNWRTAQGSGMPDTALAKGTRPEGAQSEADASRKVREMFSQIAPRYDLLNHLLSLQFDRLWRARVTRRVRPILQRPDALVLDLCCGTGDLALSLAAAGKARLIGADFAHPMLVRARGKSAS